MREELPPNNYQAGDIVCAKEDPTLKLVIRRYLQRIYYCRIKDDPAGDDGKELAYFERELMETPISMNELSL